MPENLPEIAELPGLPGLAGLPEDVGHEPLDADPVPVSRKYQAVFVPVPSSASLGASVQGAALAPASDVNSTLV